MRFAQRWIAILVAPFVTFSKKVVKLAKVVGKEVVRFMAPVLTQSQKLKTCCLGWGSFVLRGMGYIAYGLRLVSAWMRILIRNVCGVVCQLLRDMRAKFPV